MLDPTDFARSWLVVHRATSFAQHAVPSMGDSVRVNPPLELLRQRMQHGPQHLHVSELATHGLTHDHVRRWVRDGWLESLGNGSYHIVTPPTSENPAVWRRELARRRVAATLTALPDVLALYGRRKGVSMARVVVDLADARVESPGESRLRWLCHTYGIALEPQHPIRDETGGVFARADFRVAVLVSSSSSTGSASTTARAPCRPRSCVTCVLSVLASSSCG